MYIVHVQVKFLRGTCWLTACTLILACSLETTGSWILISQPSPLPKRHSCKTIFFQSQIPFPSILLTSLTIGNVDPSVPFLLITITKPHSMVGLTSCVSANIFCYQDMRSSDGRKANSIAPIWILQCIRPRCFQYAWVWHAEPCCRYKFRLRLDARYFKLFTFTNDSAPNVISVVFERVWIIQPTLC